MSFQLSLSTDLVTATYPDDLLVVAPNTTVEKVLQLLRTQRTACALVCEGDAKSGSNLVGIFTERDALKWMASGKTNDSPISAAMSTDLVTIDADATVGQAIQKMASGGYRHLPIVAPDGSPTGMAVVGGIVHYLVDHFPDTIYTLPPSPGSVPSEREGA